MHIPPRWSLTRLSSSHRFHLAGTIVAVVGLAVAAWIRATTPDLPVSSVPLQRLKLQEHQLQMIGGRFAVEAARITEWFDGLWVGRTLATTLAVITVVAALVCFWLGHIAARTPFDDESAD